MKTIRVAIIDDGVNERFATGIKLNEDYEIIENKICKRLAYNDKKTSHGTICASVLCSHACNYQLISIRILDENRKACKAELIRALEWCLENNIDLINLSIGSSNRNDFIDIKCITEKLCSQGIIIVAACDNSGIRTYPASLPGVIGVNTDRLGILAEGEYIYTEKPYDGIEVTAFSEFTIRYSNGDIKKLSAVNSYAAPYMTALVCNFMSRNDYSVAAIRTYLKENSITRNLITYEYIRKNIPLWKEHIEVPIIAVLYGDLNKRNCTDVVRQLVEYFENEGYYCSGCTDEFELERDENLHCLEDYAMTMNLNWISKIRVFYNVELPDLLFLAVNESRLNELREIHAHDGIDIAICIDDEKLIQSLKKENIPCQKYYAVTNSKAGFFKRKLLHRYNFKDISYLYKNIKQKYDR